MVFQKHAISHLGTAFSLAVFLTSFISVLTAEEKNNCDIRELDNCTAVALLLGNPDGIIARTKVDLRMTCRTDRKMATCIRRYANTCLQDQPLPRQVTLLLTSSIESMMKKRCRPGEEQEKYLKASDCLYFNKKALDENMQHFAESAQRITHGKKEDQLTSLCCEFDRFMQRANRVVQEKCEESLHKYMNDFFQGYAGDVFGLMCWGHKAESEECEALKELPPLPEGEAVPRSVLLPSLTILSNPKE